MPEVIYKVDLPAFTGRNVPIKEIAAAIGKDELLMGNEGRGKKKLDVAVEFIKEFFGSASEIASNDIIEEASHRGIKRNTLLSAKKKLGIVSGKGKQEDGTAFWTWIMPEKRV